MSLQMFFEVSLLVMRWFHAAQSILARAFNRTEYHARVDPIEETDESDPDETEVDPEYH